MLLARKRKDSFTEMWRACVFQGAVHYEFVPQGQTVNKHYYVDNLWRLRENLRRNRPENWNSWDWFLRYDNASAYSALSMRAFMAKGKMIVVP
jgi:hypothetical protein